MILKDRLAHMFKLILKIGTCKLYEYVTIKDYGFNCIDAVDAYSHLKNLYKTLSTMERNQ